MLEKFYNKILGEKFRAHCLQNAAAENFITDFINSSQQCQLKNLRACERIFLCEISNQFLDLCWLCQGDFSSPHTLIKMIHALMVILSKFVGCVD